MLAVATAALIGGLTAGEGAGAAGGPSSLGLYEGYQAPSLVSTLGRTLGDQPTFAMDFLDGDSWSALVNTARSYMAAWKNSGDTMIWGIPMLPNASSSGGTSEPSLGQGAAGAYNSYFLTLAQDMVAGGEANSIIRPGWEFNGGWYSWAANGQAAAFIGYWQQIVTTMRSVPGQNFTFEWNPTAGDQGIGNLANYYPGNAYVDYIGLDLYDQAWGNYPGISSQWNTYLTEPYGLNWLASFAATQGKQITLPEWGLGEGPGNDGGPVSNPGNNVSGGDDPTFINDMAQWISTHNVFNATFWDFGSSLLNTSSNPLSLTAFVADFGTGPAVSLTGPPPSTTSTTVPPTTTSTTSGSSTSGPGTRQPRRRPRRRPRSHRPGMGPRGRTDGDWISTWGTWSPPSAGSAFPGTSGTDSSVSIQPTPEPLVTSRGARFAAVIATTNPWKLHRSGVVTWTIASRSDASVPCRGANSVASSTTVLTSCIVAPGLLRADDGPYTLSVSYRGGHGVTPSSATITQSVAKAALAGLGSGDPRSTAGRRRRDHGDRARLSRDRRDAHGHRDVRRLGPIGGAAAVCRWERGRAHIGHSVVCRPTVGDAGHARRRHRHLRRRRHVRREHLEPVGLHGRLTALALVGESQFERSLPGEEHGGRGDDAGGDDERPGRPGVQHQDGSDERSDEHGDDGCRTEACMGIGAARQP